MSSEAPDPAHANWHRIDRYVHPKRCAVVGHAWQDVAWRQTNDTGEMVGHHGQRCLRCWILAEDGRTLIHKRGYCVMALDKRRSVRQRKARGV